MLNLIRKPNILYRCGTWMNIVARPKLFTAGASAYDEYGFPQIRGKYALA